MDGPSAGLALDPAGAITIPFVVPPGVPTPLALHLQAAILAPGGPALTNGTSTTILSPPPVTWQASSGLPAEDLMAEDGRFVDVDGDGDHDLVVANSGSAVGLAFGTRLYVNQGGAQAGTPGACADETWTRLAPAGLLPSLCVAAADVDGDGDQDLFLGADDQTGLNRPNRLFLNQGGVQNGVPGTFADAAGFPGGAWETQAAAFVDIDGDGDQDLVITNIRQPDRIFFNDGTGAFAAVALPSVAGASVRLDSAAADLDHDGDDAWNRAVEGAVAPLRKEFPTEIAFGMADAVTLQEGVRRLEFRGVRQIGVVRLFVSGESWYERTEQILGLASGAPERSEAAGCPDHHAGGPEHAGHSMEFWRIETRSAFALTTEGLADASGMSRILADRARALSRRPEAEDVLFLAHGPGKTAKTGAGWRRSERSRIPCAGSGCSAASRSPRCARTGRRSDSPRRRGSARSSRGPGPRAAARW